MAKSEMEKNFENRALGFVLLVSGWLILSGNMFGLFHFFDGLLPGNKELIEAIQSMPLLTLIFGWGTIVLGVLQLLSAFGGLNRIFFWRTNREWLTNEQGWLTNERGWLDNEQERLNDEIGKWNEEWKRLDEELDKDSEEWVKRNNECLQSKKELNKYVKELQKRVKKYNKRAEEWRNRKEAYDKRVEADTAKKEDGNKLKSEALYKLWNLHFALTAILWISVGGFGAYKSGVGVMTLLGLLVFYTIAKAFSQINIDNYESSNAAFLRLVTILNGWVVIQVVNYALLSFGEESYNSDALVSFVLYSLIFLANFWASSQYKKILKIKPWSKELRG